MVSWYWLPIVGLIGAVIGYLAGIIRMAIATASEHDAMVKREGGSERHG